MEAEEFLSEIAGEAVHLATSFLTLSMSKGL